MRRRRVAAAAAVAAACVPAACGESDTHRAVDAVRAFVGALERGDGHAACDRLTDAGLAELLLAAIRADVEASGLDAPTADRCALIAERLARDAPRLAELRRAPVSRTLLEGRRATIETRAGAYELEEVEGRWRLSRFEPVARVLTAGTAPEHPVGLAVVRPELAEPALGSTLAGRTDEDSVELTGAFEPDDARLLVEPAPGTRVSDLEARDGRFRMRLRLRPGSNEVLLVAEAPGRAPTALEVRMVRE